LTDANWVALSSATFDIIRAIIFTRKPRKSIGSIKWLVMINNILLKVVLDLCLFVLKIKLCKSRLFYYLKAIIVSLKFRKKSGCNFKFHRSKLQF